MRILIRLLDGVVSLISRLRNLWWNLARRDGVDGALDDELRAYVDLLAAEYERGGMPPVAARRAALVATGGVEQVKEAVRDAWVGDAFASANRELRYAVRALRRSPGYLIVAVATLAVGIGGATAVFTVIKGSLLRPLPAVAEPDQLVTVMVSSKGRTFDEVPYPDYLDFRARSTTLNGLAAFNGTSMSLGASGSAERVWVSFVSDDFFSVLGVRPAAGRVFDTGAASTSDAEVAVLGYDLWQRRFGGRRDIVGSVVRLDGRPFTVVGIAPPRFIGAMALHRMQVWIPAVTAGRRVSGTLHASDIFASRKLGDGLMRIVGRRAPGRSVRDVERDLANIAASLAVAFPETNAGRSAVVVPGSGMTVDEWTNVTRVPRLLSMAVALLLLIACGNVAGLALLRSTARRRELATRLALGASRATVARQVVLEGALLAVGAALIGIAIARLLVRSATIVRTAVSMPDVDLTMDVRVLGVAVAAATLTVVLVSLVPALHVSRLSAAAVLKDGGNVGSRRRGQRVLVGAQVGASLVLLYAAATVFSTFRRQLALHSAVDAARIVDVSLRTTESSLRDSSQRLAFYRAVLARAESEPGVAAAALENSLPPFEWSGRTTVFRFGEEPAPGAAGARDRERAPRANRLTVSPGFFTVMSISILRGRSLEASDDERSAPVAVVSSRLADLLWPGQNPIGRLLAWPRADGTPRPELRVVGVAADTRPMTAGAPTPLAIYLPFAQQPNENLGLVVRSRSGKPLDQTTLRRIVSSIDPSVAALGGRPLLDRLNEEVAPQRRASAWIGVFGAIALLLAAIGLYGVAAQTVLQRRRELAVRSAVGATPAELVALVLGEGMRLAAVGALLGVFGSALAMRVLQSTFDGVAIDLSPIAVSVGGLAIVLFAAAYLPARRAGRLDPAEILRAG